MAVYGLIQKLYPSVGEMSVAELRQRQDTASAPVLVDCRTPEERAVSVIPGAVNEEEALRIARDRPDADRVAVCYCTVGYRSAKTAARLQETGTFVRAYNLQGALLGWTHEGLPLQGPDGKRTNRVHVYAPLLSFQRHDYEPVSFDSWLSRVPKDMF